MTSPTIPPQPEPERVCGNCEFYRHEGGNRGNCFVFQWLPPCLEAVSETRVAASDTCVLFRNRKES